MSNEQWMHPPLGKGVLRTRLADKQKTAVQTDSGFGLVNYSSPSCLWASFLPTVRACSPERYMVSRPSSTQLVAT